MGNNTSRNDSKAKTSFVKSAAGGHSSVPLPSPPLPLPLPVPPAAAAAATTKTTTTTESSAIPRGLFREVEGQDEEQEAAALHNNGNTPAGNKQIRGAPIALTTTTTTPLAAPPASSSAAAPSTSQRTRQSSSAWSFGSLSGRLNWSFSAAKNSFRNRNKSARKSFSSLPTGSTNKTNTGNKQVQQHRHQRSSQSSWHKPITNAIFLTHFKESKRTEQLHIERLVAKGAFGVVFKVTDKQAASERCRQIININDNKQPVTVLETIAQAAQPPPQPQIQLQLQQPPPPPSSTFYALKVLRKSKIIEENSVQQIKDEAAIQKLCGHHPFIVQQVDLWQNRRFLHILSEYVPNGELFSAIRRFSIDLVRLYLAEIALAIDFLHNAGVIYRDAKPENILLTNNYHIKLTDFGLSKWLRLGATTKTMCGTFHYMAPEILRGESYGHAVDWWSIGIIVCQMLLQKGPDIRQYLMGVSLPNDMMSGAFDASGIDQLDDTGQNQIQLNRPFISIDHQLKAESSNQNFMPEEIEDLLHEARDVLIRLLEIDPKKRIHTVLALQKIALYKNFKIEGRHVLSINPIDIIRKDNIEIIERDNDSEAEKTFQHF